MISPEKIKEVFPYKSFRPNQEQCISDVIESFSSGKKFHVLESPTGMGKSAVAYTVAFLISQDKQFVSSRAAARSAVQAAARSTVEKLDASKTIGLSPAGPPILICTKTKNLQKQYSESFIGLQSLWSSRDPSYRCLICPDDPIHYYYNSPLCDKEACRYHAKCGYVIDRARFFTADIGVTNYHYFLNSSSLRPQVLILDEVHDLENILCESIAFEISKKHFNNIRTKVSEFIDSNLLLEIGVAANHVNLLIEEAEDSEDIINNMLDVIRRVHVEIQPNLKSLRSEKMRLEDNMDESEEVKMKDLSKISSNLENLMARLKEFVFSKTDWVANNIDKENEFVSYKPLSVNSLTSNLTKRADHFMMMSATICGKDQFCKNLGLDTAKVGYTETPAIIPKENRRIFFIDRGYFTYKTKDKLLPKFVNCIDDVIDQLTKKHGSIRGVIHSVSYANTNKIMELSRHADRMVSPKSYEIMKLGEFMQTQKDCVVVSPRLIEGVDLTDDLSRFQIFLKVPYASLADAWIKAKLEDDEKWYQRDAVMKIIQGAGRSIRSIDDWAYTFIFDSNFLKLVRSSKEMFPQYFLDAITVKR